VSVPHRLGWIVTHANPCLVVAANGLGIGIYAQTGDATAGTIVAAVTATAVAIIASVRILTPVLADAIRTLGPALAELQKQREEIRKGSLTKQIEDLRAIQEQTLKRADDANQKLHDVRNERQAADFRHIEEVQRLTQLADTLHQELTAARTEIRELKEQVGDRVRSNTQEIERLKSDSGTWPKSDGGK
jgi:DNA repair exonuclease SbcCD ATPase subunit